MLGGGMLSKEIEILKQWGYTSDAAKRIVKTKDFNKPVYRFLKEESFADDFCNGAVYISTLSKCRQHENQEQGDQLEGTMFSFGVGEEVSQGGNLSSKRSHLGAYSFIDCDGYTDRGNYEMLKHKNAFVLCTTKSYRPDIFNESFGPHCVRIDNPLVFTWELSEAIKREYKINVVKASEVKYGSRDVSGKSVSLLDMCFIKPSAPYSIQEEFRFFWDVIGEIEPRVFYSDKIPRIVKKITK